MKITTNLLLAMLFFFTIYNCSTIDVSIPEDKKLIGGMKNASIQPIEIKTNPKLGEDFSETLAHYFVKSSRIHIVSRSKAEIEKILSEQKATREPIFDEKSAAEMGKIKGVDVLFIGNAEAMDINSKPLIQKFRIKVVDVETGIAIMSVSKEPGIEWTIPLLAKYILGLGLIWDKQEILVESSSINHLSEQTVKSILTSLEKIENKK